MFSDLDKSINSKFDLLDFMSTIIIYKITFKIFHSQSLRLFSCFIVLVVTSRTMLNRSGYSSYHYQVSYLWEEIFKNSPLKKMLPVHLSRIFYHIKTDFFFPSLLQVFNHKRALKLIKCFFCLYRNDHIIFFL